MPRLISKNSIGFSSTTLGVRDRFATGGVDVGFVDELDAASAYENQRYEAADFLATALPARNQQDDESYLLAVTTQSVYPGKARYRAVYGIDETVPLTVDPFSVADEQTAGRRTITQPRRYGSTAETTVGDIRFRPTIPWTEDGSLIDISDYAGNFRVIEPVHTVRVPFILPYWPLVKNNEAWNKLNTDAVVINGQERAAFTLRYLGLSKRRSFQKANGSIWHSGFYVYEWSPQPDVTYVVRGGSGAEITSVVNGIRYTSRERFVRLDIVSLDSISFADHFPHELGAGPEAA